MLQRLLMIPGLVLVLGVGVVGAADGAGFQQRAREAATALGEQLKAALTSAIRQGGPVQAIDVCQSKAPVIAADVSKRTGVTVGRTALRVRNPANAPTDWQRDVLQMFERRLAAGESPDRLEWATTVTTTAGVEHRYMKPIMTGGLCLTCHGAQLAPEVAAALRERYPDDQATGFAVGDLRGAFVVVEHANR